MLLQVLERQKLLETADGMGGHTSNRQAADQKVDDDIGADDGDGGGDDDGCGGEADADDGGGGGAMFKTHSP